MGNIVTVFSYDAAHGALKELQTITTLPEDFKGASTTAEIAVHPLRAVPLLLEPRT